MTWEELVPEPISSLAVCLLVVGCMTLLGYATSVVLWRQGRHRWSLGLIATMLITGVNALMVYALTPNAIDTRLWQGDPHRAWLVGWRLMLTHSVLAGVTAAALMGLAAALFAWRQPALGFLWLAMATVLFMASETYNDYSRVLYGRVRDQDLSPRITALEIWVFLGISGTLILAALFLLLRDVLVATAFKLVVRPWRWPTLPMLSSFVSSNRIEAEQVNEDAMAQYVQQQLIGYRSVFEPVASHPHVYPIKRWREQQRRWRGPRWRVWWHHNLPVLLYCAQFGAPPGPPDYKYYELSEFY